MSNLFNMVEDELRGSLNYNLKILELWIRKLVYEHDEGEPSVDLPVGYYVILHNWLLIENHFKDKINMAGKEVLKHMNLNTTDDPQEKFLELYDVNHPLRNAVETLDSIEEIRIWLQDHPEAYTKLLRDTDF